MAFTPLELAKIPVTHSIRLLANYWKGSLTSDKHLKQRLRVGQENLLSDSWKGDGANAYGQTNEHLMTRGDLHHSQREQAGNILAWTADQFDEAQRLQDWAKEQWEYAKKAEEAGQPELAISYYTAAQTTQARVLSIIETTRGQFRDTFKRLTEELDGLPPLEELDLTNSVPDSSPTMPKDSPPIEKAPGFTADDDEPATSQNPVTPDTKQNPVTPDTKKNLFTSDNPPAFLTFDTDQKSATPDTKQNPINPDTKQNLFTSGKPPAFLTFDTDQKSATPDTEQNPINPDTQQNPFTSGNTPAFLTFDTDQKSATSDTKQNPINPDTQQNLFTSGNTPAFLTFDTDQNPIALSDMQNPLTPDNIPNPIIHDDMYNPINTDTTQNLFTSDNTQAFLPFESEQNPFTSDITQAFLTLGTMLAPTALFNSAPMIRTGGGSGSGGQGSGSGGGLPGTPPQPTITQMLGHILPSTDEGRRALELQQRFQVRVIWGPPGAGSSYTRGTSPFNPNTIIIDPNLNADSVAQTYVHEMTHAQYFHTSRTAPIWELGHDEYVNRMIDEETEAQVRAIRFNIDLGSQLNPYGVTLTPATLQPPYEQAYRQAVTALQQHHPGRVQPALENAGETAGWQAVRNSILNGVGLASTTGGSYWDYYSRSWRRYRVINNLMLTNPAPQESAAQSSFPTISTPLPAPMMQDELSMETTEQATEETNRLPFEKELADVIQLSATGKEAWQQFEQYPVTVTPGQSSEHTFYNPNTNTLLINPNDFKESAFIAGMSMASFYQSPKQRSDPQAYSNSQAYVSAMLDQETHALVKGFQHKESFGWDDPAPLWDVYIAGLKQDGAQGAWKAVRQAYEQASLTRNGLTGTYKQYYEQVWADANRQGEGAQKKLPTSSSSTSATSAEKLLPSGLTHGQAYGNSSRSLQEETSTLSSQSVTTNTMSLANILQSDPGVTTSNTMSLANILQSDPSAITSNTSQATMSPPQPGILAAKIGKILGPKLSVTTVIKGYYGVYKDTREKIINKLNGSKHSDKEVVDYINSLNKKEQEAVFLRGISEERRDNIWTSLSHDLQKLYTDKYNSASAIHKALEQFHQRFKNEHSTFAQSIQGIPVEFDKKGKPVPGDRERYALLTMHRLVFLSFLQEKGFLSPNYLQDHLKQAPGLDDPTSTSYQSFLSTLFHEGLNPSEPSSELPPALGKVPNLHIDLFAQHPLEDKYPNPQIPNSAYDQLLQFFARYRWQLDENAQQGRTDITPETFSMTLQYMDNEKEMGAYYTQRDITEYISKNAIIPSLFDELAKTHSDVFSAHAPVWSLLSKNLADAPQAARGKEHMAGIEDLITSNLDSRTFAQRFMTSCDRPDVLLACYQTLAATTILDPTCGTGAFLFAALDILSPLYEACLRRMQEMIDAYDRRGSQIFSHTVAQEPSEITGLRTLLQQAGKLPLRRYFILKSILTNNLHGVDLMPEAVEACKLCLSLKALSQVDNPEDWSGAGDLNVFAGNALVENEDFRWSAKFPQVWQRGGFRVIIGNPPYVSAKVSYLDALWQLPFKTLNCGDLYTHVIEKSQQLLSPAGYMGMIVPLAAFANRQKLPFLKLFYQWFPRSWLSFYHCVPSQLFDGSQGAQVPTAIFLGKTTGTEQRFSTNLMRWWIDERDQLFSRVSYHPVTIDSRVENCFYPKLGSPIESSIMGKIFSHEPVQNYLSQEEIAGNTGRTNGMWYRVRGPANWKVFMNYHWTGQGEIGRKSYFLPNYNPDVFVALFNSSLFFWYSYALYTPFDIYPFMVSDFRFTYPTDETTIHALCEQTRKLMQDFRTHGEVKEYGKIPAGQTNKNKIFMVHARKSKKIIDKIDEILAQHYGLTNQERDFIIKYDLNYRMGNEGSDTLHPTRRRKYGNNNKASIETPGNLATTNISMETAASVPPQITEEITTKKRTWELAETISSTETATSVSPITQENRTKKRPQKRVKITSATPGSLEIIQVNISKKTPQKRVKTTSAAPVAPQITEGNTSKKRTREETTPSLTTGSPASVPPITQENISKKRPQKRVKITSPSTPVQQPLGTGFSPLQTTPVPFSSTPVQQPPVTAPTTTFSSSTPVQQPVGTGFTPLQTSAPSFNQPSSIRTQLLNAAQTFLTFAQSNKQDEVSMAEILINDINELFGPQGPYENSIQAYQTSLLVPQPTRLLTNAQTIQQDVSQTLATLGTKLCNKITEYLAIPITFDFNLRRKHTEAFNSIRYLDLTLRKFNGHLNTTIQLLSVLTTSSATTSKIRKAITNVMNSHNALSPLLLGTANITLPTLPDLDLALLQQKASPQAESTNASFDPMDVSPAPVERLRPSTVRSGPASETPPAPYRQIDLTGQLLQNPDHPFVQTLASTEMGRSALAVEQTYGGRLITTNGTGSFYESQTNTITIGLGKRFALGAPLAQKRLIHEQTHRWYSKTGKTANPLAYELEEYVHLMLQEEADAEGNAIDHLMELSPQGPFTASERIYVDAYQQGYDDLKKLEPLASEEKLAAEGRKKGKDALFQEFKRGNLVPSIGEYENYSAYYEQQWHAAWKELEEGKAPEGYKTPPSIGIRPAPTVEDESAEERLAELRRQHDDVYEDLLQAEENLGLYATTTVSIRNGAIRLSNAINALEVEIATAPRPSEALPQPNQQVVSAEESLTPKGKRQSTKLADKGERVKTGVVGTGLAPVLALEALSAKVEKLAKIANNELKDARNVDKKLTDMGVFDDLKELSSEYLESRARISSNYAQLHQKLSEILASGTESLEHPSRKRKASSEDKNGKRVKIEASESERPSAEAQPSGRPAVKPRRRKSVTDADVEAKKISIAKKTENAKTRIKVLEASDASEDKIASAQDTLARYEREEVKFLSLSVADAKKAIENKRSSQITSNQKYRSIDENKEAAKIYEKKRYKKNKEHYKEHNSKWEKQHRNERTLYKKQKYQENPERFREYQRIRAFVKKHGGENLVTLADLNALTLPELRAEALRRQEEAHSAMEQRDTLMAQRAPELEIFEAKKAVAEALKNARLVTKAAQAAGISITLPDTLAKEPRMPLTNQQKLLRYAKELATKANQSLEEFALLLATLMDSEEEAFQHLQALDPEEEELKQAWEELGLADMDQRVEVAIEKAKDAYLRLIALGEKVEIPALLQERIRKQRGEADDETLVEHRDVVMEDLLPDVDEQDFVRRSQRIQRPPFELMIKNLDPHFGLPSYTAEADKRAGGKYSQAVLSPYRSQGLVGGTDANSQLPGAIKDARQLYPQAFFKAGHLLNADLGGDGKDAGNLTILTAAANSRMTAFDNPVKYALLGLYNLYKELYKDTTLDLSQFNYGIQVEIRVSDEKWGKKYPDNCIAQRITCQVTMVGKAPDLTVGTRAATIHQALLNQIQFANDNGIIENRRAVQQESLSSAAQPKKRKATAKGSERKRKKASPQAESTNASFDPMDIRPAPVETLSPSAVKFEPAPGLLPVPLIKHDLTGQLLRNPHHPFTQDLMKTWAGRGVLKTEYLYGKEGQLFFTNGTGSSYDPHSNTISIGLGATFELDERFAQKRLIHEMGHRWLAQTGQTAYPLQFNKAADYANFMHREEAEVEGNAIDHIRELNPIGPFRGIDAIYIYAYRDGYEALKKLKPLAEEQEWVEEGRKKGKEALFQAFQSGALAPSIGEYKNYTAYYEQQWHTAWKEQAEGKALEGYKTPPSIGIRPAPVVGEDDPMEESTASESETRINRGSNTGANTEQFNTSPSSSATSSNLLQSVPGGSTSIPLAESLEEDRDLMDEDSVSLTSLQKTGSLADEINALLPKRKSGQPKKLSSVLSTDMQVRAELQQIVRQNLHNNELEIFIDDLDDTNRKAFNKHVLGPETTKQLLIENRKKIALKSKSAKNIYTEKHRKKIKKLEELKNERNAFDAKFHALSIEIVEKLKNKEFMQQAGSDQIIADLQNKKDEISNSRKGKQKEIKTAGSSKRYYERIHKKKASDNQEAGRKKGKDISDETNEAKKTLSLDHTARANLASNEARRKSNFVKAYGEENFVGLKDLLALTPEALNAEALKWQTEALQALAKMETFVDKESGQQVLDPDRTVGWKVKNAKFATLVANEAKLDIPLPGALRRRIRIKPDIDLELLEPISEEPSRGRGRPKGTTRDKKEKGKEQEATSEKQSASSDEDLPLIIRSQRRKGKTFDPDSLDRDKEEVVGEFHVETGVSLAKNLLPGNVMPPLGAPPHAEQVQQEIADQIKAAQDRYDQIKALKEKIADLEEQHFDKAEALQQAQRVGGAINTRKAEYTALSQQIAEAKKSLQELLKEVGEADPAPVTTLRSSRLPFAPKLQLPSLQRKRTFREAYEEELLSETHPKVAKMTAATTTFTTIPDTLLSETALPSTATPIRPPDSKPSAIKKRVKLSASSESAPAKKRVKLSTFAAPTHLSDEEQEAEQHSATQKVTMADVHKRKQSLKKMIENAENKLKSLDPVRDGQKIKSTTNTLYSSKSKLKALSEAKPKDAIEILERAKAGKRNYRIKSKEKIDKYNKNWRKRKKEQKLIQDNQTDTTIEKGQITSMPFPSQTAPVSNAGYGALEAIEETAEKSAMDEIGALVQEDASDEQMELNHEMGEMYAMDTSAMSSVAGTSTTPLLSTALSTTMAPPTVYSAPPAPSPGQQHPVSAVQPSPYAAAIKKSMENFHQSFKQQHATFSQNIHEIPVKTDEKGNPVSGDRERYALLMMNRLVFLAFLQQKGFLPGERNYLQTYLTQAQEWDGPNGTSYHSFLSNLFYGLNAPAHSRPPQLVGLLGKVPSLNMDLFGLHPLELAYTAERKIPNRAYDQLLQFFAQYHWQLDDAAELRWQLDDAAELRLTDITPEIFSRTLQQMENDKEKGVVYTPKDVTDYIGKNAILPSLFEELERRHSNVFSAAGPFWSLLQKNFDNYTYGIEAKGKAKENIATIQDLITSNLDSGKLAADFIATSERPDVLLDCYESLAATTVLDPTCGTGAFLFAALDILSSLYLACLTRMQEMVGVYDQNYPVQTTRFRAILKEAGDAPSHRYFILKSIITRNLYGVDIMEEAVEICKLCLSLKLLAQVDNPEEWSGESFSTGLLNVFPGNALVEDKDFQWSTKFPQVLPHDGFRVIIGNPPYSEFRKSTLSYAIPQSFETLKCQDLYTLVVEKSRRDLLSDQGYMGMIIPIGAFSAKGKLPFLNWFYREFPRSWVSFYDYRPSKLFDEAKGAGLATAIFLGKTTGEEQRFSTKLMQWYTRERAQLFSRLSYSQVTIDSHAEYRYYPKFAHPIESRIMEKIRRHQPVKNYLSKGQNPDNAEDPSNGMWYRSIGASSWKVFMNYKWTGGSTTSRVRYFKPGYDRDVFVALLNSSLFFWYYATSFDVFNMLPYMIDGFGFTYPQDPTIIRALCWSARRLMNSFRANADHHVYKGNSIMNARARKSKKTIDAIDGVLAKHYGLTKDELNFILNYDLKYRMGSDYEGEAGTSGGFLHPTRRNEEGIAESSLQKKKEESPEDFQSAEVLQFMKNVVQAYQDLHDEALPSSSDDPSHADKMDTSPEPMRALLLRTLPRTRRRTPKDITGQMWANPHDPITQAFQSTPEGQHALAIDQQFGVKLHIGQPGAGSGYQRKTKTVTLEPRRPAEQIQKSYIHEMTHAWYHQTGRTADPRKLSLAVYVQRMLDEEATAEGNAIRHHLRRNGYRPSNYLEETYWQAYKQGRDQAWARYPHATLTQWHEAGLLHAHESLVATLKGGGVLTSTTQENYEEYYTKQWHAVNKGQKTSVVSPAPMMQDELSMETTEQASPQSLLAQLRPDLERTAAGRKALERQEQYHVAVIFGQAGDETFYDWKTNTLSINPEDHMDSAFVSGMWWADFHHDQTLQTRPLHFSKRSDYVEAMLDEETNARVRGIRQHTSIGGRQPDHLEAEYTEGNATGEKGAGWNKVRAAYSQRSYRRAGWTGTYKQYYGQVWDDAHAEVQTLPSTPKPKRKKVTQGLSALPLPSRKRKMPEASDNAKRVKIQERVSETSSAAEELGEKLPVRKLKRKGITVEDVQDRKSRLQVLINEKSRLLEELKAEKIKRTESQAKKTQTTKIQTAQRSLNRYKNEFTELSTVSGGKAVKALQSHKNKRSAYHRAYYIENQDILLQKSEEQYYSNRDTILEKQNKRYINKKHDLLEYQKQYRIKNKEHLLEYQKQYNMNKRKEATELAEERYNEAQRLLKSRNTEGSSGSAGQTVQPLTSEEETAILDRLKLRLKAARKKSGIKRDGRKGGTFSVAETTLPLADKIFMATSPNAGGNAQDEAFFFFKPPTTYGKAQNHAEQGLTGSIAKGIIDEGLTDEDLRGHTVFMHIEKPVCFNCKQGLFGSKAKKAGVLKQFSQEFKTLHIQVTAEGTDEVIHILNGESKATSLSTTSVPPSTLQASEEMEDLEEMEASEAMEE